MRDVSSTDKLSINPEIYVLVPRPPKQDFEAIKNSIGSEGQQEPIVAWKDPKSDKTFIVDGHTRYQICKELNLEPKVQLKEFESWLQAKKYAIDVNLLRRQLSDLQKVQLALSCLQIEKQLAAERKRSTIPKKGQKGFQSMSMPDGINTGSTDSIVAKKTGLATRTVARIKRILEHGSEKLKQEVATGNMTPATAERLLKKENYQRNPIPLPKGKYRIVLCDVPYQYALELEGAPDYPTLPVEEIIKLKDKNGVPITSVFAEDCIVFFWSPIPKLEEALKILNAWEFTYKTAIVWSKEKDGKPQEGTGYYIRATCELLLIATKGKIGTPLPKNRALGVIKEPRTKVHSQKPARIRSIISRMYPNEKYLELFGRERVEDWDVWGDQIQLQTVTVKTKKNGKLDDF